MFDLKNIAMNLITRNPAIANNPQAQDYLNVIQNGDSARGYMRVEEGYPKVHNRSDCGRFER